MGKINQWMAKHEDLSAILILIPLLLLFVIISTIIDETPVDTTNINIEVTSLTVKNIENKYRYFFDIRNNGKEEFSGSVKIYLLNRKGGKVWDDTFETYEPIQPGVGKSVYADANTGPTLIHGDYGVEGYEYEVKVGRKIVKKGSGKISLTLE